MRSQRLTTLCKGHFWPLSPNTRGFRNPGISVPVNEKYRQSQSWLAFRQIRAASVNAHMPSGYNSSTSTPLVRVQGPHKEDSADHKSTLTSQLENIPKDSKVLQIDEDTPSDTEWDILGEHFSNVHNLEMNTGFNEELNDKKMPLHWPLERLKLSSASAEVFQSPHVLQGRVKHLILLLTSGLRFEGPTSAELQRAYKESVKRGETTPRFITVMEGTPEERQIEVTYLPELVAKWMTDKYSRPNPQLEPQNTPPEHINLETLEILENDAMDSFCRMATALPHLVDNLKTLNIRSTHGLDFHFAREIMFTNILPHLTKLQTFQLSVGEVFEDENYLPTLYTKLPPNLTTLLFRGPVSLCRSEHWEKWLESFASKDFLPDLQKLGFVLDLHYEKRDGKYKKEEGKAPEELLREARAACEQLYAIAAERGITIQPVYDKWTDECQLFRQVDDRWSNF